MTSELYQSEKYWRKLIAQSVLRFLLLRILRSGPVYGYVLPKAMSELSDELLRPSEGAIYSALSDFRAAGLIDVEERVVNGRTQKVYKITENGRLAFRQAALHYGKLLPILRRLTTL